MCIMIFSLIELTMNFDEAKKKTIEIAAEFFLTNAKIMHVFVMYFS